MIQEHVHFVRGEKGRHGLHVVMGQTVVMAVWVLTVEYRMMMRHPPRLICGDLHLFIVRVIARTLVAFRCKSNAVRWARLVRKVKQVWVCPVGMEERQF